VHCVRATRCRRLEEWEYEDGRTTTPVCGDCYAADVYDESFRDRDTAWRPYHERVVGTSDDLDFGDCL
jgi:hypothetical protein